MRLIAVCYFVLLLRYIVDECGLLRISEQSTFEEIGEEYCVSAGAVEKAVKNAIEKLRKIW